MNNDIYQENMIKFQNALTCIVKLAIFIGAIIMALLFITRPDLEITQEHFENVAASNNYKIFKVKSKAEGATSASKAVSDDERIEIYYIGFNDKEDSYNFYKRFLNKTGDKYGQFLLPDYRVDGLSAEKQSFIIDSRYYVAIYTKNAVIFSEEYQGFKKKMDLVFDELYKLPPIKYDNLEEYYSEYFKKFN